MSLKKSMFLRCAAAILSTAVLMTSFGCSYDKTRLNSSDESSSEISSEESSQSETSSKESSTVSEYPSASSELSSITSEDVSSVISKLESINSDSSSASTASKPTSSETPSEPMSVEPPSETPSEPPVSVEPPPVSGNSAQNADYMKAVWISYLEFQGFAGSSEGGFTNTVSSYFDTAVSKGLNTVIVQVRPHGDSFYSSSYYPWSKCVSGVVGQSVSYDPLEIMVEQAHARGLAIHAWINPYRTMTDAEMALVDSSYPVKQWYESSNRSQYMVKPSNDGRWWLKPGNGEVQQLIVNGAVEIVNNYDVDGIHLDDYFYGGDLSYYGDSTATAKANTSALISWLYSAIKAADSSVLFGVSPSGAFREADLLPHSDLAYLSTDLALWCSNPGYIDYVMPQLYWDYNHSTQPFTMTLNKWQNFVTADSVRLIIGVAPSGLPAATIEQQVSDINSSWRASGYCLYRYEYIKNLSL